MVTGFTKFKENFQGFENQYVVIGGTACDLIMENEELPFRATKDIDIVLIVESITADFGKKFWDYIKEAGYEHKNKSTGEAQFYRFTSPRSKEYPYMIEIFSRNPEFITLDEDAILTPLPIDESISSLSAILLNEAYYELLRSGQVIIDGIPVLKETCLIPFKAKAWLDLNERKAKGELVDSKNIKKQRKDAGVTLTVLWYRSINTYCTTGLAGGTVYFWLFLNAVSRTLSICCCSSAEEARLIAAITNCISSTVNLALPFTLECIAIRNGISSFLFLPFTFSNISERKSSFS